MYPLIIYPLAPSVCKEILERTAAKFVECQGWIRRENGLMDHSHRVSLPTEDVCTTGRPLQFSPKVWHPVLVAGTLWVLWCKCSCGLSFRPILITLTYSFISSLQFTYIQHLSIQWQTNGQHLILYGSTPVCRIDRTLGLSPGWSQSTSGSSIW